MKDLGAFDSDQRMRFLVSFINMKMDNLRPGDWLNLRDDLGRFLRDAGQWDLVLAVKGISVQKYPEEAIKSLCGIVKILLSQAANASQDRTGVLQKTFGIPTSIHITADFRVSRSQGDFVRLAVSGKLSDVFLFQTLFLLSRAPIEPIRECPECGNIFYRQDKRQKFCSRRCANLAGTKRWQNRKKAKKGEKK